MVFSQWQLAADLMKEYNSVEVLLTYRCLKLKIVDTQCIATS